MEIVNNLVTSGCKIAIATTDRSNRANIAMHEIGLGGKIDLIIGADRVSETKPDPEMVFLILETLKMEKNQTLMIGDAITDIEMGNRAGLAGTIAVLTGQTPPNILKENTPYVINSVADIGVIVDE
jgi:phosphoglycolate phosphatase-like HAD superfamily hydrolase